MSLKTRPWCFLISGSNELGAMRLQPRERPLLVALHQRRVAHYIGSKDGCKLAFHEQGRLWLSPAAWILPDIRRMSGSSGKIDARDGHWQARTAPRVPEGRQHRHVACRKLQIWSSPRRASPLVSAGARSGGGCSFRDQADLFGNVGSAGSELRRLDGAGRLGRIKSS